MGSGSFGVPVLHALHRVRGSRVRVATVPDAPAGRGGKSNPTPIRAAAKELGLDCYPVATLKHPAGVALLQHANANLVIVCDFRLMLPSGFLAGASLHCYNLHPSLLPRYRGAAPVARTVLAGDLNHGVTLYRMVRALDAGPIVARESCSQLRKHSRSILEVRLGAACGALLVDWIDRLEHGDVPLQPQEESQATFAPRLRKEEAEIRWYAPPDRIQDHVLGMWPWPGSVTSWVPPGQRSAELLLVHEVQPVDLEPGTVEALAPGTVRSTASGKVLVACGGDGLDTVALLQLQRPGKRALASADFLRGAALPPGHRLGDPLAAPGRGLRGHDLPLPNAAQPDISERQP